MIKIRSQIISKKCVLVIFRKFEPFKIISVSFKHIDLSRIYLCLKENDKYYNSSKVHVFLEFYVIY